MTHFPRLTDSIAVFGLHWEYFGGVAGMPDIGAEWPEPFCAARNTWRQLLGGFEIGFGLLDLGDSGVRIKRIHR